MKKFIVEEILFKKDNLNFINIDIAIFS